MDDGGECGAPEGDRVAAVQQLATAQALAELSIAWPVGRHETKQVRDRTGTTLGYLVVMGFDRITTSPDRMGGVPCIRDLRFPVATVVAMVADGMTHDEILREHPELVADDITDALHHAALAGFAGALPDVYEPDELNQLRDEWD